MTARDRVAVRSDLLPRRALRRAVLRRQPRLLGAADRRGGANRAGPARPRRRLRHRGFLSGDRRARVGGRHRPRLLLAVHRVRQRVACARRGAVDWVVGDAERLRLEDASFDRVLLSLVLHQLVDPEAAVGEAFRVLAAGGLALVRTIAPEDAVERVPERYLPSMAAPDASRLPEIAAVEQWLARAGFGPPVTRRVPRNKRLSLADEERQLLVEVRSRYPFIGAEELEEGLRRMRADAQRAGEWIDPRPTYLLAASKPG